LGFCNLKKRKKEKEKGAFVGSMTNESQRASQNG
jgi:hypothetical protein